LNKKTNNVTDLVEKKEFFDYLSKNNDFKEIMTRNYENFNEIDQGFDEELLSTCILNLKGAK
jgi:hypothetical protein